MQGVVIDGGGGVVVWVVGCRCQGWVVQGVIVDGGGGWWCGWWVVNAGGDAEGGVVVVAIVALMMEVVGWWWGSVVVGWWFMERVRMRDLEKILKCLCLRVFAYIIISAH